MSKMLSGLRHAALMALLALPAAAHHSVAGQFDVTRTVKFAGTVSRVDWINPHTYIDVDVTDAEGKVTTPILPAPILPAPGVLRA